MNKKVKEFILSHKKTVVFFCKCYNMLNIYNRIQMKRGNRLIYGASKFDGLRISYSKNARCNIIEVGDYCQIKQCRIVIHGNYNHLIIGNNCSLFNLGISFEDNLNEIIIGDHTSIMGETHLAVIESTKIKIGKDCLFSNMIWFRTGDSHSIVNDRGERTNRSKDILIGDHCWLCQNITCLKGTTIGNNCVIGINSTLNKNYSVENAVIAGNPASVVKRNISWVKERIPVIRDEL